MKPSNAWDASRRDFAKLASERLFSLGWWARAWTPCMGHAHGALAWAMPCALTSHKILCGPVASQLQTDRPAVPIASQLELMKRIGRMTKGTMG